MIFCFLTFTELAILSVNTVRINEHALMQQLLYDDSIVNRKLSYITTQIP